MGVEYMFAKNWIGFPEYNYIDFDTKNEAFALGAPAVFTINADLKNKLSIAKVGVNYKFRVRQTSDFSGNRSPGICRGFLFPVRVATAGPKSA
jgi:hypothetical protein